MPYIGTKVNVPLNQQRERSIQAKLDEAIALLPGKSARWLMTSFEDGVRLHFQGDSVSPAAFVEVKVFGSSDRASYEKLTAAVTTILGEELGIAPERVYVAYGETDNWGWNGGNF